MITTIEISTKIENTKYGKPYSSIFVEISEKLVQFMKKNKLKNMTIEYIGKEFIKKENLLKVTYKFVKKNFKDFKISGKERNKDELTDKAS